MRDEDKSKEQLIEELLELRQRVADLEDSEANRLRIVRGEFDFVKELPGRPIHAKDVEGPATHLYLMQENP